MGDNRQPVCEASRGKYRATGLEQGGCSEVRRYLGLSSPDAIWRVSPRDAVVFPPRDASLQANAVLLRASHKETALVLVLVLVVAAHTCSHGPRGWPDKNGLLPRPSFLPTPLTNTSPIAKPNLNCQRRPEVSLEMKEFQCLVMGSSWTRQRGPRVETTHPIAAPQPRSTPQPHHFERASLVSLVPIPSPSVPDSQPLQVRERLCKLNP